MTIANYFLMLKARVSVGIDKYLWVKVYNYRNINYTIKIKMRKSDYTALSVTGYSKRLNESFTRVICDTNTQEIDKAIKEIKNDFILAIDEYFKSRDIAIEAINNLK